MGVLKRHKRYQKRCKTTRVQRNVSPKVSSASTSKLTSSASSNNIASCGSAVCLYPYKYDTALPPARPDTDVACAALHASHTHIKFSLVASGRVIQQTRGEKTNLMGFPT